MSRGLLYLVCFFFCVSWLRAQEITSRKEATQDTLQKPQDTTATKKEKDAVAVPKIDKEAFNKRKAIRDSIAKDSIYKDSVKRAESPIKTKISYKAKDYVRLSKEKERIYFYNEAELNYGDIKLTGGVMEMDYITREIHDGRIRDEKGALQQAPVFKQSNIEVKPDSIKFNYTTKKSVVWNSRTSQGDGTHMTSNRLKKENDSVYYIKDTYVTTSADPDNPEYYFKIRKAKLIPDRKIITGPTNMYIADVPTPLGLPFVSFPLGSQNRSGVLFPTYGQGGDRGFFLQNGGYYLTLGDYFDAQITGDYYTSASYAFKLQSTYKVRYKLSGNLNFSYENLVNGERGFDGYSRSTIWNIRWSHQKDQKSGPNSTFSASVNLGSSTYYRQSLNQLNTPNFLNNSLSSSISYSKTIPIEPAIRMSLTATHTQNNNTRQIDMTLPTFQASIDRVYPFEKKGQIKKGALRNINFQYNVNAQNQVSTSDSLFLTGRMFDKARNGVQHQIPIATNFKIMKFISGTLSVNADETWTFQSVRYNNYDPVTREAKKDTISGFNRFGRYSFSAGLGTTIYGTFLFGEDKKIQGIRHVMRPSITFGYSPDQKSLYDKYVSDAQGTIREYTRFEPSLYGTPSQQASGSIGFSISNDFEAKVREKDTTKLEPRRIKLLSNLNLSASYNMLADSLKWSTVSMGAATSLLKNKLNINFSATLDPYAINANGTRINTSSLAAGSGLFRLTNARVNFTYGITSEELKRKKNGKESPISSSSLQNPSSNLSSGGRPDDLFGQAIQMGGNNGGSGKTVGDDKKPYYNYSIPWRINITQAISYTNDRGTGRFDANSIMFSGGFDPAPRWSISLNSGFDFEKRGFTFTQINFQRDLKSWQMTFSWTPTSTTPTWYFFIGIKANVFKDIKLEQRGRPDRQL